MREQMKPYRLMDDSQLSAALASLEREVAQLDYLRQPVPQAVRSGLTDALDAARQEAERRRA